MDTLGKIEEMLAVNMLAVTCTWSNATYEDLVVVLSIKDIATNIVPDVVL